MEVEAAAEAPEAAPFEGVAQAIQENNEPAEQAEDVQPAAPQQQRSNKPAGYDPVDFETATPDQLKQRYDYLYKQVKDGERTKKEVRELREIAAQQFKVIEELQTGFTGVVDHLTTQSLTEREANLERQRAEAWEAGDTVKWNKLNDEIIDLRVEKKLAATQKKEPAKKEAPQRGYKSASQVADEGYEGGEISFEDKQYVDAWEHEKDDSGNLLRPWAFNQRFNPNDPMAMDDNYKTALIEMQAISVSPRFQNASMDKKLAELDRRMGVTTRTATQNVMGGNLTTQRKSNKITLSPKQQEIAVKTKFGGPKATDAEHIDAYRKQLAKVNANKGAR